MSVTTPGAQDGTSRSSDQDSSRGLSLRERLFGDHPKRHLGLLLLLLVMSIVRLVRYSQDAVTAPADPLLVIGILFGSAGDRRAQTFGVGAIVAFLWLHAEDDPAIVLIAASLTAAVHYVGLRYAGGLREPLRDLTRAERAPTLRKLVGMEVTNAVLLAVPVVIIARNYLVSHSWPTLDVSLILLVGIGIYAYIAYRRLDDSIPTPIDA